jgi:hypothetical protein
MYPCKKNNHQIVRDLDVFFTPEKARRVPTRPDWYTSAISDSIMKSEGIFRSVGVKISIL